MKLSKINLDKQETHYQKDTKLLQWYGGQNIEVIEKRLKGQLYECQLCEQLITKCLGANANVNANKTKVTESWKHIGIGLGIGIHDLCDL